MSANVELEGEMGELEGDADMSEWASLIAGGGGKKPGKPHRRGQQQSSAKESTEKVGSKSAITDNTRKSSSHSASQSKNSPQLLTPVAKTTSDPSKKPSVQKSSDVGDIAGVIGILDSSRNKTSEMSKTTRNTDDKKSDPDVKTPSKSNELSSAAARKRKPSFIEDTDSSKAKRGNNESDRNGESAKTVEVKDEKMELQQVDEKDVEKLQSFSEEDCKSIDSELVEKMMESVRKEMIPKSGDKYIVKFSPVELADLADETLQKLVTAQPNLAFYFKRQGKLKKKKGYAEVYLSQMQEARVFLQKLLQIKLIEDTIEVTLTVSKSKQADEVLSFTISMNKNDQLLKLIKRTDDAKKGQSGAKKEHFQIDKVPVAANALMLRTLFPFSAEVIFSTAKKTPESGYRGPVSVHYASVAWIDAVLDCCSNFTYNEYNLSIQHTRKKQETKTKPATEVKKDAGTVPKRGAAQDGTKTVKDGNSSSGSLSDNNT